MAEATPRGAGVLFSCSSSAVLCKHVTTEVVSILQQLLLVHFFLFFFFPPLQEMQIYAQAVLTILQTEF